MDVNGCVINIIEQYICVFFGILAVPKGGPKTSSKCRNNSS